MWLANHLQVGSFFIFIAFKGVFVGLLLLITFRETSSGHVKGLNSEIHVESKSEMVSANWSTSATAITNLKRSSWDPSNAIIKSAMTQSSPKINTQIGTGRSVLRKKRSKNSPLAIDNRSSQQNRDSMENNTIRYVSTSTKSFPIHQFSTSTQSSSLITSTAAFAYLTPSQNEHHIRLRTSTTTTIPTEKISAANSFNTEETTITERTIAAVTNTIGFSDISETEKESVTVPSTITIPNTVNEETETLFDTTTHDLISDFYDDFLNATNSTEQLKSNFISNVTVNSVVSTTEFQQNNWLPPLSSNSADPIALNPTVEGVNSSKDLLGIGAIIGIIMGVLILVVLVAGIFGFLLYRKRLRPLTEVKYPTDNCGYVDDTLRVSYMNNHIELPNENSEEMFSLDNDSFLNSLEAMTLQNYWAEDAKNTKV